MQWAEVIIFFVHMGLIWCRFLHSSVAQQYSVVPCDYFATTTRRKRFTLFSLSGQWTSLSSVVRELTTWHTKRRVYSLLESVVRVSGNMNKHETKHNHVVSMTVRVRSAYLTTALTTHFLHFSPLFSVPPWTLMLILFNLILLYIYNTIVKKRLAAYTVYD